MHIVSMHVGRETGTIRQSEAPKKIVTPEFDKARTVSTPAYRVGHRRSTVSRDEMTSPETAHDDDDNVLLEKLLPRMKPSQTSGDYHGGRILPAGTTLFDMLNLIPVSLSW